MKKCIGNVFAIVLYAVWGIQTAQAATEFVTESGRKVPVAAEVDVVVVGGSSAGVAAAVKAAEKGASVLVISSRPYLGADICGTYRLWLEAGEAPDTDLSKAIFGDGKTVPLPLHVKATLEKALLDAGVNFLLESYPVDILVDPAGKPAGIVMANRAGRQAIVAKVIIDDTPRASVARFAGAKFSPLASGPWTFKRIVVGGEATAGNGIESRELGMIRGEYKAVEYTLSIPMKDDSFASFARADQIARDKTWQKGQEFTSEFLFYVPQDNVKGQASGVSNIGAFRPEGINNIFVLGGCANMPREEATKLLRPVAFIATGYRIGEAAGATAKSSAKPGNVKVAGSTAGAVTGGDVCEFLYGVREMKTEGTAFVESPARSIPVIGKYDVVVVGGGTAGAPAGIAAARQGAKTLVVEYLHGLGGTGTLGMIGRYWYGNRVGFSTESDQAVANISRGGRRVEWRIEDKMEWYRKELVKAGADTWFCSMGCGAFVEGGKVKGVVVATPEGRGIVLCDTVIDATGNSDIAIAAGAGYRLIDAEQFAMQGTGLSPRDPKQFYINTDWTYVNESDVIDRTRMYAVAKSKFAGSYDISPLIVSRERRSVVGDYELSPLDVVLRRTFRDTIVKTKSNFDSHGYTIYPVFKLWFPTVGELLDCFVPYRCLLPKGLDGILVSGIGISVHRDALPVVRMQPDVQNQGYAAGVAAAIATKTGKSVRNIDIKAVQKHLVEKDNLSAEVLTQKDAPRSSGKDVEAAVAGLSANFETVPVIFDAPESVSIPILQVAYKKAGTPEQKLIYARVLGLLGDGTGASILLDHLKANAWDAGWTITGMGNHGSGYSAQDSMIIGLGKIGDKNAVPVILDRLKVLNAESEFSHFSSCAMALESFGDKSAAKVLAEVLKKDGITGHAFLNLKDAIKNTPADKYDITTRGKSLLELKLARALYMCGDQDGMGKKILEAYTQDVRGLYAIYARMTLNQTR